MVALTADVTTDNALDAFHKVWWLIVISGVTVTGLSTLLPKRVRARAGTAGALPVDVELAELQGHRSPPRCRREHDRRHHDQRSTAPPQ